MAHFIVQCPHYADARAKLWEALHGNDAAAATAAQQLSEEQQALAFLADTMWPEIHEDAASAAAIRELVQNFMYDIMADRQWWVQVLPQ